MVGISPSGRLGGEGCLGTVLLPNKFSKKENVPRVAPLGPSSPYCTLVLNTNGGEASLHLPAVNCTI